jgi:hypothetical protein
MPAIRAVCRDQVRKGVDGGPAAAMMEESRFPPVGTSIEYTFFASHL